MANETPDKPKEVEAKATPNFSEAEKKVASIESQLEAAKGKPGHNPFIWRQKNDWNSIVAGVKAKQGEALSRLSKIPDTINTSVANEPKGPLVVETPPKK